MALKGKKAPTILAPVLHLQAPGTLRLHEGNLVFEAESQPRRQIRIDHLRSLICQGPVEVTASAMKALARKGIDVAWLSGQGSRCDFRLDSAHPAQAMLRVRQVRAFDHATWKVFWSKMLVGLKIDSLMAAARHGQRHGASGAGDLLASLTVLLDRIPDVETIDQARGFEGAATAAWYRYFATRVPEPFAFAGRKRRPPPDPVNSLLSLSSMLLCRRVEGQIQARGLEASLGILHTFRSGRPSLACDLMEPFRPQMVDRWVLRALRSRVVGIEDFREAGEEGVRLKPEAFSRVLRHWEQEFSDEDMGTHIQNLMAVMVDSWKMEGGIFQKEEEPDTFEDDWGA